MKLPERFKLDREPAEPGHIGRITNLGRIERLEGWTQILTLAVIILAIVVACR